MLVITDSTGSSKDKAAVCVMRELDLSVSATAIGISAEVDVPSVGCTSPEPSFSNCEAAA